MSGIRTTTPKTEAVGPMTPTWRYAATLCALLMLCACDGDGDEAPTAPSQASTAASPGTTPTAAPATRGEAAPPTEAAGAAAEQAEDAGVTAAEDAGLEAAAVRPEFVVPPYAPAPEACEPHPELAPEAALPLRDVDRGVPEFPMVEALNATCEHDVAELAATFNRGGLRRHRQRDYEHSQHYFGQALVADPSQLSPRFNLACALARTGAIDEAIEQLHELERAGPEGQAYAARAQTDRDFGEYHGTPTLAALVHGLPPAIDALPPADDRALSLNQSTVELRNNVIMIEGRRVWEGGPMDASEFQSFVLTIEPSRRRYHFYAERPSDAASAALDTLGLRPLLRHAAWSPSESLSYVVVPVSSRDEVRHTLYIAGVPSEDAIQPLEPVELPAATCAEGVEAVQHFVATPDHRAFGYVVGCLDAAPQTFQRCLFYFADGAVHRRCGRGAVAPPAATPVSAPSP